MGMRAFVIQTVEHHMAGGSRFRRHYLFVSGSQTGESRACLGVSLAREKGGRGGPSDE
jgi:hypothetical protein